MNETKLHTIEQIEDFLSASTGIEFLTVGNDGERYEPISRVLKRFDYPGRHQRERGVLRRYLQHTSGYSRAQVTRLVARWQRNRLATMPLVKRYRAPVQPFARRYTAADIALLAEMDRAHEGVCGPAIVHLLRRAYGEYHDPRYERVWRRSPPRTCTTCARAPAIGRNASISPRPARYVMPWVFAGPRLRTGVPALSGSIPSIKGISTASRGVLPHHLTTYHVSTPTKNPGRGSALAARLRSKRRPRLNQESALR